MKQDHKTSTNQPLGASFRDPSGFIFNIDGVPYRQINQQYQEHYEFLMESGLYEVLINKGYLIPHQEVNITPVDSHLAYKVIQPERISYLSYPYEWCFTQLKDAALVTLEIQKCALEFGMTLKDSSAYNIQFHRGRPVLIDTLSFEIYNEGEPWVAYRQFCQHFIAPLCLMAYRDIRFNQLLRVYIDGIPLDLASSQLPIKPRLKFPLLLHIHLHASSQKRYSAKPVKSSRKMSKVEFLGLIDSLESAVNGLRWSPNRTEWVDYYDDHNYSSEGLEYKNQLVVEFIETIRPQTVWDLGANTGYFSRLASDRGIPTIAFDIDQGAVEQNYLACKAKTEEDLLPLYLDLTNPSPGIGWHNRERMSFIERGPADVVLSLALIHHLAISNNVPFQQLSSLFRELCSWLIIEFIPKSDAQVQRLLAAREDIFPNYTVDDFENIFSMKFKIHRSETIFDSERHLYLMEGL
jgi:hypothetical protein